MYAARRAVLLAVFLVALLVGGAAAARPLVEPRSHMLRKLMRDFSGFTNWGGNGVIAGGGGGGNLANTEDYEDEMGDPVQPTWDLGRQARCTTFMDSC